MNYVSMSNIQHMIARGAKHLASYEKDLNAINVFPVPDGDTGSNLAYLMNMILFRHSSEPSTSLEAMKLACLQGSRGNSGMIFSQFIMAMCDFISEKKQLTQEQFVEMCSFSVKKTFQAVQKPMEGTILTVMKDWVLTLEQYKKKVSSIPDMLTHALEAALQSLEKTKLAREEFRKLNVVDAGAKGFCYFLHGFIEGLGTKQEPIQNEIVTSLGSALTEVHEHSHQESTARYCTEFIVKGEVDENQLREKLSNLGDSLVFIHADSYCKLHIHSDAPHTIASLLQEQGQIIFQKVEDMQRQQAMLRKDKLPIAIVVDSACDLPQSFLDEHHIHLLPLSLSINGSQYLDKQTITADELYKHLAKEETTVQSSLPSREQITRLYMQLSEQYEHIYSIHVSSALSGTYGACKQIAEQLNTNKIHVVDSKSLSGAYGLLVKKFATYMSQKQEHLAVELTERLNKYIQQSKIFVTVPSLESMVKSGRLSKTAGKIAHSLSLKPIVTLDEQGKAKLINKRLFSKSNLPQLIKQIKNVQAVSPISEYALLYTDQTGELAFIEEQLISIIGRKPSFITTVSSIIGKYAGPNAYGIAVILEDVEKARLN